MTYAGPAGGGGTTSHSWLPILWSEGGDVKNKDGKWIGSSQPDVADLQYLKRVFIDEKLVPSEVLTLPKPWTTMRQKMGQGGLAILFEGGWVYGSWSSIASAADLQKNIGTILFPYNNGSGDFTVGGLGTCWYISSQCKNKDLAWDWIATWNNAQTVAKLNIEDPHPVPRSDAADVPDFKSNAFLVTCTESLKKARFEPTDANWSKITTSIQQVTGQVASGQLSPEDGQKQLSQAMTIIAGSDNVVTQ